MPRGRDDDKEREIFFYKLWEKLYMEVNVARVIRKEKEKKSITMCGIVWWTIKIIRNIKNNKNLIINILINENIFRLYI